MTYQVYLIREDVALDELIDLARRESWELLRRMPRRGNLGAFWEWSVGAEERAYLIDSPFYGVRYVSWPEARPLPDFWAAAMTRSTVEDATAKAQDASSPAD